MTNKKNGKKVKGYFRRTLLNKIFAIAMVLVGLWSTTIDGNITVAVFAILFAIPLFFSRRNWIY